MDPTKKSTGADIEDGAESFTLEFRTEFHGTKTEAEAEASRIAASIGGRVTAIFDEEWEEV